MHLACNYHFSYALEKTNFWHVWWGHGPVKDKGKGAILLIGASAGCWSPFLGHWAMANATPDLRLPSRPKDTVTAVWPVLVSHSAEGRRLSWPKWPITYQDGIPATRSPISLLWPGGRRVWMDQWTTESVQSDQLLRGYFIAIWETTVRRRHGSSVELW